MPFARPTLDMLIARAQADMQARLPGADPCLRRNLVSIIARMSAGTEHGLYGYLDWLALQLMPDTAEREHLERWASIWGVTRKAATNASGMVALQGDGLAVLPTGSALQRSDGRAYQTVGEAVLAASGSGTARVAAVDSGPEGNAPAGTQLMLASPVPGINAACTAANGLAGGAGEERDASLRSRLLAAIQRAPMGGTRSDYERWCMEVPGVTRAFVSPGEMGPGTVTVRIMMDDTYPNGIPQEADRLAVSAYLADRRPVTAHVYVTLPVPDALTCRIRITPDTASVRLAAEAQVRAAIRRDATPGGTVHLSRIGEALSLSAGEVDHAILHPVADVTPATGHVVVYGGIEWEPVS